MTMTIPNTLTSEQKLPCGHGISALTYACGECQRQGTCPSCTLAERMGVTVLGGHTCLGRVKVAATDEVRERFRHALYKIGRMSRDRRRNPEHALDAIARIVLRTFHAVGEPADGAVDPSAEGQP
jgi:hypothetical protein